jgi:hypothetical protein
MFGATCGLMIKGLRNKIGRQAGRQAGRHDRFYYTSTKCAIPDDIAGQQLF